MKFILGISGASGIKLALGFLKVLPKDFEIFVVLSFGAQKCAESELNLDLQGLQEAILSINPKARIYQDFELQAPIASGSFGAEAMAVIPASMDCVAKIACGISDTLLTRSASVMIKEHKKLLLAPREIPLSAIICKNLHSLAHIGVFIAPPILGYYSCPQNLEEMECFIYGKWLDCLGIPNVLYRRWGESSTKSKIKSNIQESSTKIKSKAKSKNMESKISSKYKK